MSVFMRRAKVADLDRIMVLERETFEADAWPEDAMRRELESPHAYYLIAVDDEADDQAAGLLGYAGLLAPKGGGQGDIQTIAVAPAIRGIGLGRGLMHALITEARRRHVAEIFLEVRADNPIARALYDSLGFEEIGIRRRYYRGGIDAVHMRLTVPPAVAGPADAGAAGAASSERTPIEARDAEAKR
ncbi:ribosomal protein S18-alanine N-acetyltransferase [Agromyces cerinus]|uniref:Ribosomal-protein-alanine N-acetyltransferase n=1 Tax=Agromyces cerinus subsp. cerinus TaxID=232089 RepID=A0A1N6FFQ0_9MICO|nr:ribosomal protein S18-alanine N-acetyltransferase [Agromyces cerinus]SIN94077.1 ribosomal-protein-alanine N-acetyltransferase [Agromyces cerinus subsp. cerinus]